MSINRGQINPLSVLGIRKLSFIPEHFSKLTIDKNLELRLIERWIEVNLNSRYSISHNLKVNNDKKIVHVVEIGLEDPKELTMLTLGCQHLYKERMF
jgi:hypothetical protein